LFRFAKRHCLIFADPTRRLHIGRAAPTRALLPMTDTQIAAVGQTAVTPAQRLVVALVAVHAARAAAIRELTLDDIDLAARRIILAGHPQPLSEFVHEALVVWLQHRRRAWPHTPNRHVPVSAVTATGTAPVSDYYLSWHLLLRGVQLEQIRADRVLHEALAVRADPLHLAAVFNTELGDRDRLRRHRPQPPRTPHRGHPGASQGVLIVAACARTLKAASIIAPPFILLRDPAVRPNRTRSRPSAAESRRVRPDGRSFSVNPRGTAEQDMPEVELPAGEVVRNLWGSRTWPWCLSSGFRLPSRTR